MFGWLIGRNKGFQPNTIPNMRLWLDATRINQANNTAVATWSDQSGNGYDATQGGSAARPTFIASGLNGLPVVRFDGTDDRLALSGGALGMLRNVAGATVFAVVKYNTSATIHRSVFISTDSSGFSRYSLLKQTSNNFQLVGRRLNSDTTENATSIQTTSNNIFYIHSGILDYGNAKAFQYVNGKIDATDDPFQTAGNTSDTDSNNITVGASGTPGDFLNGDIAEIIVYNRALNTSELAQVHRYLSRKWGIQLA